MDFALFMVAALENDELIGGQRIKVGLTYAGKTSDVTIRADTCLISVEDAVTITAPRTTSHGVKRHKASN